MSDLPKKGNFKANIGSVNTGVFDKIEELLKNNETNFDINSFHQFLAKGFATQATQSWSYYSHVNDHVKFTSSTITLTKLIKKLGEHYDLIANGLEIIKDILVNYSKTLYRGLSSTRPSITNPILRLINEFILFQNGSLVDDFVALFEFQLPVLPKLLIPTKQESSNVESTHNKEHLSIRYCFIRVLINLLKYSNSIVRKDFLAANSKIMSNWFKYLPNIDSDALISITLKTWDEFILREPSFKKSTKLKVFNEWNIIKLIPLYYSSNKELRTEFHTFLTATIIDPKHGLKFTSDEAWLSSQKVSSSTLLVNGKNFKLNNKFIYSILTNLKPWDDDLQMKLIIESLSVIPELICPFLNYLSSRGLHDPKLTSYWLGQTLLLSKIIRLQTPEEIIKSETAPSISIVKELVLPSTLNRSVLTKCLNSDVFLIRQLSAQLIMDTLIKLNEILKIFTTKDWQEGRLDLINSVYSSLPELSAVASSLSDSYSKQPSNKILLATNLMIINTYLPIFPDDYNYSSSISKPYVDLVNSKTEFSNIDLVLLDNFFQLQQGYSSQLKWWNKSDTKSNSLFTLLLKITSSNKSGSVSSKISHLLQVIVQQTVIFNYKTLKVDPITILIHSLQILSYNDSVKNTGKIWKLLDETISRSVKTPFKYLDSSNELERLSPFIVALFEQWKFVESGEGYETVSKWLVLYLRYCAICGEPIEPIQKLLAESEIDSGLETYLTINETSSSDKSFTIASDISFFEFATTAPLEKFSSSKKIPISDFDIIGAFARVKNLLDDESLTLKEVETPISALFAKIGDYLFNNTESSVKFSSVFYWGELYLSNNTDKSTYISSLVSEVFEQLPDFDVKDFSKAVIGSLNRIDLNDAQQLVLSDSLWSLRSDELRQVLNNENVIIERGVVKQLLEKKQSLLSDQIITLLDKGLPTQMLIPFFENDLIVFGDLNELFLKIVENPKFLAILPVLLENKAILPELVEFIYKTNDKFLFTYLISRIENQDLSAVNADHLRDISKIAEENALKLIKSESFDYFSAAQLSNVFIFSKNNLDEGERSYLIHYFLEKSGNKYNSHVAKLIGFFKIQTNEIKLWINKSILYLTKVFAEFTELPEEFLKFVQSIKDLLLEFDISTFINKSNINALLEVIFTKWPRYEVGLEFASVVIIIGKKHLLDYGKLLQILANNEGNVLIKNISQASAESRFLTVLILWRLFEYDVSKNSTIALQEKILQFYNGTTHPEDLMIYRILERLETKLNSSWIDNVISWDLLEGLSEDEESLVGEVKLIEKKKEGFIITLSNNYIQNGLDNYQVIRPTLPVLNSSKNAENREKVQQFYQFSQSSLSSKEIYYDPLFLSLLIINNEELVNLTSKEDSSDLITKTNIKKLIDSGLLSSIIINLASEDRTLYEVSVKILSGVLNSLEEEESTFKDRLLVKLFLTKIVSTLLQDEKYERIPLTFIFVAKLVPILTNPGHILYEKAFRWVLKSPSINSNDIPLYHEISTFNSKDSSETSDAYYKQVQWFLQTLTIALKSSKDIQLLKDRNLLEWLLNLQNSPFVNVRIKYQILEILSRILNIETGSNLLITRYGGLLNIEQEISKILNEDSNKELKHLQNTQYLLNLQELALKYSIAGHSVKRVNEWTSADIGNFSKRSISRT
ncbi:hypothetical protein WICMUC_001514 [Wickerhamomyces mucosus]|uniref:Nucleolar pre-ribosomal-associated protein 1 n=1 Tax=Wickerhamomyces mucosus TaxID=1378264 RepID=A0A9P8PU83_9ASCO|nr:hypothetical protein WICMUC_001514 [Wickerhamomyces mucosus]